MRLLILLLVMVLGQGCALYGQMTETRLEREERLKAWDDYKEKLNEEAAAKVTYLQKAVFHPEASAEIVTTQFNKIVVNKKMTEFCENNNAVAYRVISKELETDYVGSSSSQYAQCGHYTCSSFTKEEPNYLVSLRIKFKCYSTLEEAQ